MRSTPVQLVEAFHLIFLRVLESVADRSTYVVKGGVNLRAWFGSQRLSEDLDIDVLRGEVLEVQERVDRTLAAPAFGKLLEAQRLQITRTTRPKETGTTQRWKLGLAARDTSVELHTKVELSRRGSDDEYVLEPVLPAIVRPYGIPAPTANHYTATAAIWQKVGALVGRSQPQARDIWDLDHLFRTARTDSLHAPDSLASSLSMAIERVIDTPFDAFRAQVVPFLEADVQDLYMTPDAWERIQQNVADRLSELLER